MRLSKDWHLHSKYSTCGHPEASVAKVYTQARQAGVEEFGLTDHLHTAANIPALAAARREFDALDHDHSFHFGVELSCVRAQDIHSAKPPTPDNPHGLRPLDETGPPALFIPEDVVKDLHIEYVVAGVHWSFGPCPTPADVIKSYFQQYLYLIQHPLVDIVAHPWWWEDPAWLDAQGKYTSFPWFDDFDIVPRSMHEEFAAAAREHKVAVEINPDATFLFEKYGRRFQSQYIEYLHLLAELGVRFSIGSDQHENGYLPRLREYERYMDQLGLRSEDLWDVSESKIARIGQPVS